MGKHLLTNTLFIMMLAGLYIYLIMYTIDVVLPKMGY
jgi:hypothetical protein